MRAGTTILRGAVWPSGLALAWVALALRSPHVTYHLAPLLVAASLPVVLRLRSDGPVRSRVATRAALTGLGAALGAAALLAFNAALSGPALWHGSGALETPLVAAAGAAWGWRTATRRRTGLLGRLA